MRCRAHDYKVIFKQGGFINITCGGWIAQCADKAVDIAFAKATQKLGIAALDNPDLQLTFAFEHVQYRARHNLRSRQWQTAKHERPAPCARQDRQFFPCLSQFRTRKLGSLDERMTGRRQSNSAIGRAKYIKAASRLERFGCPMHRGLSQI